MRIRSETDGVVYDGFFATHSGHKFTSSQLELVLRRQALMWRGIVIADSDLNNQPAFHGQLDRPTTLRRAIETAFIRRAARQRDDGPIKQGRLLEELAMASPKRGSDVPRNHVAELERVLDKAEAGTPPITWSEHVVGKIFAWRLIGALSGFVGSPQAVANPRAKEVACGLRNHVRDWLAENATESLRAATLETHCPNWRDSASEKMVWDLVLGCYDGNLPAAWDGDVIWQGTASFPAGPEATEAEKQFATEFYEALSSPDPDLVRSFSIKQMLIKGSHRRWQFDDARLVALSLDQVVEIRERANAEEFFAARYKALAGPADADEKQRTLIDAEDEYLDRLHQAGVTLTKQAEEAGLEQARQWAITDNRNANTKHGLAALAGLSPAIGPFLDVHAIGRCAANEAQAAEGKGPLVDEALASVTRTASAVLSRPDYRVVERRARDALADDSFDTLLREP